jgi:hypothetical protein
VSGLSFFYDVLRLNFDQNLTKLNPNSEVETADVRYRLLIQDNWNEETVPGSGRRLPPLAFAISED